MLHDGVMVEPFVEEVRNALAAHGDPERAEGQQAYMKSELPYYGVTSAHMRLILKPLLAQRIGTREQWLSTIRELWDEATHREEWYAALALARHRHYKQWRDPDALDTWRHLIVTGAWWDVVDETANHLVKPLVQVDDQSRRLMHAWAISDDLWLRRTAIICQLGLKHDTDLDLLTTAIEANLEPQLAGTPFEREFFLRKAIGWALRDYARADPDWVRGYVDDHVAELSGLSRREALKHLA